MTIKEKHDRIAYVMECLNRRRVEGRKLELSHHNGYTCLQEEVGVGSSGRNDVEVGMSLNELYYYLEGMMAWVWAQECNKTCPNLND